MRRKKCQRFSLLWDTISFPPNVICFWVSIVLSFFNRTQLHHTGTNIHLSDHAKPSKIFIHVTKKSGAQIGSPLCMWDSPLSAKLRQIAYERIWCRISFICLVTLSARNDAMLTSHAIRNMLSLIWGARALRCVYVCVCVYLFGRVSVCVCVLFLLLIAAAPLSC